MLKESLVNLGDLIMDRVKKQLSLTKAMLQLPCLRMRPRAILKVGRSLLLRPSSHAQSHVLCALGPPLGDIARLFDHKNGGLQRRKSESFRPLMIHMNRENLLTYVCMCV